MVTTAVTTVKIEPGLLPFGYRDWAERGKKKVRMVCE